MFVRNGREPRETQVRRPSSLGLSAQLPEEPGVALASIPSQQLANTEEPDEEDEIMVSVKGRQIPFTEVTASMEAEMTVEEYKDYFELCNDLY